MSRYCIHPMVLGTKIFDSEAYGILLRVRDATDILIPLHEPRFASVDTIP